MKLHEAIHLLTASIPLVAAIWYIAEMKAQIYKYIDVATSNTSDRIDKTEKEFEVFLSRYSERKEFVDYQLHGLNEKINHKFQRCMDEIKLLKGS